MAAFDTVIRHGTVVTASETFRADVAIKDGRIVSLGESLTDASDMIDATGMLVLPGGIDSHVHISQPSGPGIVMADDFAGATRAAAFGGNTFVMPYCLKPRGNRGKLVGSTGDGRYVSRGKPIEPSSAHTPH